MILSLVRENDLEEIWLENGQALDRKLVEELIWGEWGSQIIKSGITYGGPKKL